MGRRSLPKVDRSISIDQHYFDLEDFTAPIQAQAFFAKTGDLEIEIGSGKGLFLLNASARHPDKLFLGLEIAKKYARFSAYRLSKHGRENAKIIRGDAMIFVDRLLHDETVSAVHVYFPDPWWKERHRRRRVMQPSVIQNVQRILRPDGTLHFWTDVEEYFATTCELILECTEFLQGPYDVAPRPAEHDMDFQTHFERRMRLNDHRVFRAMFTRQRDS